MATTHLSGGELASVRRSLLDWYSTEQRDFPWRRTRDPYAVLVSEVMLQQTQASRAAQRFPRFMTRFPSVRKLARARSSEVLAEWAGLGYNRRAVALQRAAAAVVDAGWPGDVAELERLPGIGPYTARAVASLAFGARVGVVDTNVRRWLLRRFGVRDSRATLQLLADALAIATRRDEHDAASWTHASMEFGARVCTSRAPRCDACPLAAGCPSRGAATKIRVVRQPTYAGSSRARRGALLRALAGAPGHRLSLRSARLAMAEVDRTTFEATLNGLERDDLAHRSGRSLRLGPASEPSRRR